MFFMNDILWVTTENIVNPFQQEKLKGYGTYAFLVMYLKHQLNKTASIDILPSLSQILGTKKKYLVHIIKDYHLFDLKNDKFTLRSFVDNIYPFNMASIAGNDLLMEKVLISGTQIPIKGGFPLLDPQPADSQQELNLELQQGLKHCDLKYKIQSEGVQPELQQESKQQIKQPIIQQDLQQVFKLLLQQELKPQLL